ncbi:MAG TPA: SDR family oxidoreductase, partial [Acidimicrobiales bacterium]
MEISLEGKVALVTGASRGIGRAIAAAYAGAGAAVMLSSRKQEALEAAAGEIGGDTAVFAANAGEPDQIAACVAATVERFGRVDILVNNAATNPYMGRSIEIDLPRFDKTWQVNYRGPVVWVQEAWRSSMREHGGVVINIASVGGLSVETHIGHYNVTKAALMHLTRTLAADLAPHVRMNAIAPGLVKTDMARALWEPAEEAIAARMPLRRLGQPEDIANAA